MTLEHIIILSFLLVLIQITIPVFISLFSKNIKLSYLFSSRDEDSDTSIYEDRANRALKNLFETFPIFIGLVLLSITKDVDNTSLAFFWLIARVIYVPIYILGVDYLRTGVWAVSLTSLVLMSVKFL
tara:strand:+ start:113 stop:493 length:381 start_codon:yes stop_codon:yes gene_type:complete